MTGGVGLSSARLLEVVDAGTRADTAQRGRLLLGAARPRWPDDRLDASSLSGRDRWLLELRSGTFGETLGVRVSCPACGMVLAAEVGREHIPLGQPMDESQAPARLRADVDGFEVQARAPDGAALAAAAACSDVASARASLISSCVVAVSRDGRPHPVGELSEAALEHIGEAILFADPEAEVRIGLNCAGCGHEWSPILDIGLFFWREIETTSVQLLDDVHALAIGYGWSEEETLKLSSRRRRQYVERLADG